MARKEKYALGQQDFRILRERGSLYIDKTGYLREIVEDDVQYYFLARPRRFGKSLFLSTIRYFFEGRRDLFKGLEIESMPWDWIPYPVLYIDFNQETYSAPGLLEPALDRLFKGWENEYDVTEPPQELPARFHAIIEAAHRKTGRLVVVLVDEYDKALVGNLHDKKVFEHYRDRLGAIYSNFKSAAEHLRLVFITGVSRFGRLSVFSDLNNLVDITFVNEYADICGITEIELLENCHGSIEKLAESLCVDFESACKDLKENYDGYRFTVTGSDIYNPWSVLNAMRYSAIDTYWNDTGLPTVLAESLKRLNVELEKIFDSYCTIQDLKGLDLLNPDPRALLYQTGYLTIKDYNPKIKKLRLGIPNKEVKEEIDRFLLPYFDKCPQE